MYGWLVLLELVVGAVGFAFTANIDALAGGLVMAVVGSSVLAILLIIRRGRLPIRSLAFSEPWIISRLAVGNVIMNVAYVIGIQAVGIGAITTMTALGPLFVKGRAVWAIRRTRKGVLHIALRAAAVGGVIVVNKPWTEFGHFDEGTITGIICGLLGAWSFWNYVSCFFGDRIPEKQKVEFIAVADLISLPFIALVVWVVSHFVGGGYSELWTQDVLFWGTLAGIVGFTIPTIITALAAEKVDASTSGMLYMFDTPIANIVGFVGAFLGWLGAVQSPDLWGWIGMVLVTAAVGFSTKLPSPEILAKDLPGKGR